MKSIADTHAVSCTFRQLTPTALAELVPALAMGTDGVAAASRLEREDEAPELAARGWLELERVASAELCERVIEGVHALRGAGLPAVFLYAFDEVWEVGAALRDRLSAVLETEYTLVGDVWAFWIPPGREGWSPHRGLETRLDRDRPEYVNGWVAMTDAGVERSCLHFVPLDADPAYGRDDLKAVSVPSPAVVAAPLQAGAALVWNANTIHWGGPCTKDAMGPRVSITFTLCRADAMGGVAGLGQTSLPGRLDPWARLELIARQILVYGDQDPDVTEPIRAWAKATTTMADQLTAARPGGSAP